MNSGQITPKTRGRTGVLKTRRCHTGEPITGNVLERSGKVSNFFLLKTSLHIPALQTFSSDNQIYSQESFYVFHLITLSGLIMI
jgi:hypothetical protein